VIFGVLATVIYKYAPQSGEDNYITNWIRESSTTADRWLDINAGHTAQSAEVSSTNLLMQTAQRPPIRRMQNPQYVAKLAEAFSSLFNFLFWQGI
jgi:hypothetical protein